MNLPARIALALSLPALLGGCAARSLDVMTFNVRYADDKGPQPWPARRPVMVTLLKQTRPDVIGTQELLQRQGDDLVAALPGYRWFGRDRRGGHADEHMGILYRTDRLTLIEQGDFWLSETPDRPGSADWGVDLPRMANWGVFELSGGKRFLFVDTHFPHRSEDADARRRAAELIVARLPSIARDLPVVLAGDFNAEPDTEAYRALSTAMTDVWTAAPNRTGPAGTYHDFTGKGDRRIDYLFVRKFRPKSVETDRFQQDGRYPSDHFPVRAKLTFE